MTPLLSSRRAAVNRHDAGVAGSHALRPLEISRLLLSLRGRKACFKSHLADRIGGLAATGAKQSE